MKVLEAVVSSEDGFVAPAFAGVLEAPGANGQTGTVLRKPLKKRIGDQQVGKVVGVDAIVMDHPGRVAIGVINVAKETFCGARDLLGNKVETFENIGAAHVKVLVRPVIGHEVRAGEDLERVAGFSYRGNQTGQLLTEHFDWSAAPRVVGPEGDYEQIGIE